VTGREHLLIGRAFGRALLLWAIRLFLTVLVVSAFARADYREGIEARNRGDYERAYAKFKRLADEGHAQAQMALGQMYRLGLGVPKNPALSEYWRRRAAQSLLGRRTQSKRESPPLAGTVTGTGFVVDEKGRVVTSHHVVEACSALGVRRAGRIAPASLGAYNPGTDLAVLSIQGALGARAAVFRSAAASLGEAVVVAGFPLQGLLSEELHVATGSVSALAGPRGHRRLVEISAPVQAGNSGGPLLDDSAQVIGMVVGTMDALNVQQATGQPPQNVNFAVRGELVRRFLDEAGGRYRTASFSRAVDTQEIAAAARHFTLVLECLR
jgi:S1-C subfamily serine protease